MKKGLIFILAVSMLFGLIGCTKKTSNDEGDIPTLTWYVPGDKQPEMGLIMEEANKIIFPAIGAKIDLQMLDGGGFQEKMTMMMSAGEVFDMTFTGAYNSYDNAVDKGGLLDITDMIDKYAPKLREVVRDYAFKNVTRNGRIYGIPNIQIMAGKRALFIQKKLAGEFGLDIAKVKKTDDIEPFLEWVHSKYPNLYPYHTAMGVGMWDFAEYVELDNTLGIKITDLMDGDDNVDVVWLRDTRIGKHGIEQLRSWYQKGYIRPDVLSVTDDNLDRRAGKYAVMPGAWKPGAEAEYFNSTGMECVVAKLDAPAFSGGAENTMISISRTSKNPEKSMKFIELINTNKELYNLISFGIEGKHYIKGDDNKMELIKQSGYFQDGSWKFGCVFNSYIMKGQDDDVWEKTIELNDSAEVSPLLGFVLDNTAITSEISAVSSINSQYKVLGTGAEDPDVYWKQYVDKLNVAGIKKIEEETEKQINQFLKSRNQ